MTSIYLDNAAAWIYRHMTGQGSAEMAATRRRMMSHPQYDEKILALAGTLRLHPLTLAHRP
jgi:hypothetical protein